MNEAPERQLTDFGDIVIAFIAANGGECQEYALLKHIEQNHGAFFAELTDKTSLYQKHFLLFHYLYRLNCFLSEKNLMLTISPLKIQLLNTSNGQGVSDKTDVLSDHDPLKVFYLNKENLNLSHEEVAEMQQAFWQKYLAIDQKSAALKLLNLVGVEEISLEVIKKQYRRLANEHHPDKGGNEEYFVELQKAYQTLKLMF